VSAEERLAGLVASAVGAVSELRMCCAAARGDGQIRRAASGRKQVAAAAAARGATGTSPVTRVAAQRSTQAQRRSTSARPLHDGASSERSQASCGQLARSLAPSPTAASCCGSTASACATRMTPGAALAVRVAALRRQSPARQTYYAAVLLRPRTCSARALATRAPAQRRREGETAAAAASSKV
jgi:hypothetical protein